MISLPCPQCGGEFMQVETENSLDLICLACRPAPVRHLTIEDQTIFGDALRRSTKIVRADPIEAQRGEDE